MKKIKEFHTISNMELSELAPNEHGDWLNQRNDAFFSFIPLTDKIEKNTFWKNGIYCRGLESSRDSFVYQSNKTEIKNNMKQSINFFNSEVAKFNKVINRNPKAKAKDYIAYDDKKISWSRAFLTDIDNLKTKTFDETNVVIAIYRPFFKQYLYFSREMNNVVSRMDSFFPTQKHKNLVICLSCVGSSKELSVVISDIIPDLHLVGDTQCFPLYYYKEEKDELFQEHHRQDAISDFILKRCKEQYGKNVTKEDIFYYVYGFLHSPKYREAFTSDLKKMLPRLPLVEDVRDFWAFSKAGRALAELHLNYENVGKLSGVVEKCESQNPSYLVEKMRFGKNGKEVDKSKIIYNSQISLENIPDKAYEYVVNGKSAIEWIMERYQVTTHKESGIVNNPNDWAKEMGKPRYILDLLHSVINLSVQTVKVVQGLPGVEFGDTN
ncbi:MAG: hypothetical protein FWC26_15115 [Fibromonadales bacterium]|nr:hypothetical protein [Fibromonadales bacterium]